MTLENPDARREVSLNGDRAFNYDSNEQFDYPEPERTLVDNSSNVLTKVNGETGTPIVFEANISLYEKGQTGEDTDISARDKESTVIVSNESVNDSDPDTRDTLTDESIYTADGFSPVAGKADKGLDTMCRLIVVISCLGSKQF